jgi:hypothetical protein
VRYDHPRWLSQSLDHPAIATNSSFAGWVNRNRDELLLLGPGRHFGEWWGSGIQCGYGLTGGDKRFSLFNVSRWDNPEVRPSCCGVVPTLYRGLFSTGAADGQIARLTHEGSLAAPGFMRPEGIVIFHTATGVLMKKTLVKDESPKTAWQEAV